MTDETNEEIARPIFLTDTERGRIHVMLLDALRDDATPDLRELVARFSIYEKPYWRTLGDEVMAILLDIMAEDIKEQPDIWAEIELDGMDEAEVSQLVADITEDSDIH